MHPLDLSGHGKGGVPVRKMWGSDLWRMGVGIRHRSSPPWFPLVNEKGQVSK